MAEKWKSCSLAVSLAVASLTKNWDLARKLASLSEQLNADYLYEDALRQWVDMGVEWDAKQLAHEYSLKQESTQIKFKAMLFGWLLANTNQWDDAIRQMMIAIGETWGTVAEWLEALDIMSKLDLTDLEEVAQVIWWTVEEATKITKWIRKKISHYIWSNYSVVTSGSQIKAEAVQKKLEKEIKQSKDIITKAKNVLWKKTYKDVNKDLARLQNAAKDNKKYWSTKAWRNEIRKLATKYWTPVNKDSLERYLNKIINAQKTLESENKILDELTKEYNDALKLDLKIVEDWQNPYNYVWADWEWKFNKTYNKDISERVLEYWQYALARTLLTDKWGIPQSVYDILAKTVRQAVKKWQVINYLDEDLTEDWILDEDRTLDELLSRAYTNTEQLVSNWQLRNTYRQRLISLASDWELSHKDVSYLESLFRTMRLAWEWAWFADSFKYTALLDNAKELWIKVPKNDGKELWKSIIDFFQDPEYDKLILNKSISLKWGVELTHRQLLELVSWMLNDVNIYRLIASNDYTDSAILDIAWKYLVWDAKQGNKKLLSLVSAVKEIPTTDDTRGVILKAITGKDIPADTKVWFFDFRSFLSAADDVKARAEFRDRLADGNKLNVPSNTIKNISTSSFNWLTKELEQFKGGYILVNDSQWKMNSVFVKALNTVNEWLSDSEKVHIAFPTGWLMWNLSWTKWKWLVFKTSYSEAFNEFMRKVSIRTLWQTQADSAITKEIADAATRWNLDAISKMNQLLEEDARKYFGAMLWVDPYSEDLPYLLEDMTWISFKNYDKIVDKTEFWKKIDEKFMVWLRTVGNYDQEVTTVADVLKQIDNMTPAQIAADLSKKFWYEISEESITEWGKITDKIKNAYINYNLSQTSIELLENKWKLLAVVNWWVADNITIDQFRGMLLSDDYSAYKEIFFHNVDLSDEELAKHVKQINTMVLDWLCAQVADNLIAMWYSLPLVNVRDVVYDYLTDNLNVNWQFANAFIYKNNLPPTLSTLQGIMNEAMPSQLRFGYDDAVEARNSHWLAHPVKVKWELKDGRDEIFDDYITRYVEVENQFMPDTYSSLVALSAIKDWARLPNVWHERQVLKNILDDYHSAVKRAVDWKNITFAEAQKLKTQAWYALDMYEQDYLYSRYKQFLTPDEKNELFWLKYWLWVTTNKAWLDDVAEYNNRILDRYDNATKRIINQNDIIVSSMSKDSKSIAEEVEKRQKELIDKWATMKVIDWQVIVVNIRDELYQQLRNIPDSISWLGVLKSMWRVGLDQLTNEQAYFLLNVVELTKNADNKMNMISQTIYKLKPQLAKIDFFRTFRAVDWLPFALRNNLLTWTDYLAGFNNTATFDDAVKREIFDRIKNAFSREWKLWYKNGKKVVSELEHLNEIINDAIDINVEKLWNSVKWSELKKFKKEAAMVYQMAFNPYTILEDVPKVVKDSMNEILDAQQKWIRDSLKLLWDDDRLTEIMDAISIQLDDGSVKTLRQILDGDKNNLSKTMFDTDLDIINSAEDNAKKFVDPSWSQSKREAIEIQNKKIAEATENNYRDWLQAYLNEAEVVSQWERELLRRVWSSARELAKQYTLTNKLAETDNALYWINEEIVRWFKSDILWFKWLLTRWWQSWLWLWKVWENIQEQILERWTQVKDRYRTLYNMTPEQLAAFEPKNALDTIAANMAKYFKEMEGRLWSIDWVTWATTDMDVNRAFAHIWEVVMNIDSIQWLYSIMSGIEWNQLLKFFRFANVWDAARVEKLVIGWLWEEWFWWYRNYVDKTDNWLDREWFNRTFASNFTDSQYTKLIQALCWFTVVNKNFKLLQRALNAVNGSNYLIRVLMSYPGQLITVWQQSIAYFLKQIWWEKELWIEDLWAIDAIRQQAWILKWAYNEIPTLRYVDVDNLDSSAFYNRYWLPDVDDLMQKQKFYTSDDLSTMYSKIDDYWAQSKWSDMLARFLRNTDAYKDNANNIIDWLFARNFKNIAFVKALQSNNYMTFATAEEFANFMASSAPTEMKTKLMAAVMEASGRNFKNILWLGFSGLDRAVWWGYLRNIFIWLMQMFNFRWAWWQNMARQTSNWIMTWLNMAKKWLSKEWKDAIATYIAHQPEFVNFTKQLFNDLQNMWHLVRFQDNWDWMPEDEHSMLDFIEYAYEVMQFSSQWWQWIQSYWTTRIATEWWESVIQSAANPEVYKDTYWVGALMNNISKNLWRNWKVPNLWMRWIAVWSTHWWDAAMEYLWNEFWKLSFWTLRYLMNEDETSYWYNTELIWWRPGAIPSIISWETSNDWDKAYSYDLANSETWLNITSWYDAMKNWDSDTARIYYYNNLDSFINGSQARSFLKNAAKALRPALWDSMRKWLSEWTLATWRVYAMSTPWDLAEVWDLMAQTAVGSELFTQWYSVPRAEADIKILVDEVLKQRNHRPWNDWFNKSMFNFDKSGHMASLEKSNEADAGMEMLLNNIKYERGDNFEFITDEQWRKIVTDYWQMHMNDLNRRINDEDYMTMANFNFINGWVEANNDDPNYMFYKRLIWEWLAGRYMNEKITEYIDWYNKINWLKKDAKLTKTELTDASGDYQLYAYLSSIESDITWERRGFLESIMLLDKPAALSANIKMIARQMEDLWYKDEIKKMFNVDEDGNVTLSNRYQAYLEEQAKLSKYLDEWDLESFIAETASITRLFEKDDPYGLATTMLITSRINRINQADSLSVEQKAKAINVLMTDNYEFIQQHIPEFIDELWSAAKAYIAQMNESLYDVSLIWDDLTRVSEMNKSSSWRSSWISISNKAKNLLWKLWSSTGSWRWVWGWKTYNYNYVPVRLEGSKLLKATGSVWYNPISASIAIAQYKPHIDLSIWKDINRNIKTTKTQPISTKKQLSDIEKKTTKALTAES